MKRSQKLLGHCSNIVIEKLAEDFRARGGDLEDFKMWCISERKHIEKLTYEFYDMVECVFKKTH